MSVCGCGCGAVVRSGKSFAQGHHNRTQSYREQLSRARYAGGAGNNGSGYLTIRQPLQIRGQYVHVAVAEKALGRSLPSGAEVHHVNEDHGDNRPTNLVICPTRAYHLMLHVRAKAFDACGHADWRRCGYCKQWDAPQHLKIGYGYAIHPECRRVKERAERAKGTRK